MNLRTTKMCGVLRMFVESANVEEGKAIANELTALIDTTFEVRTDLIATYWKIPAWLEIVVRIPAVESIGSAWAQILPLCTKWQVSKQATELNAIWTAEVGGIAFHPKVRWISVTLFPM